MSIEAVDWAMVDAPDVPAHVVSTLIGLARYADPQGLGAAPTQEVLAHYTRKDPRTVRRDLVTLRKLGLIRRGDQRRVAYLPPDRRPVVYDLALERRRPMPADLDAHIVEGTWDAPATAGMHRADACVRPAGLPSGHRRPGGRTPTSGPTRTRADASVHRRGTEEENTTSALAAQVLGALGPQWRLGWRSMRALGPAVDAALADGWTVDGLRDHLKANPQNVRSPEAVLRYRLANLPVPAASGRAAPVGSARCRHHRGQTADNCGPCRSEQIGSGGRSR